MLKREPLPFQFQLLIILLDATFSVKIPDISVVVV